MSVSHFRTPEGQYGLNKLIGRASKLMEESGDWGGVSGSCAMGLDFCSLGLCVSAFSEDGVPTHLFAGLLSYWVVVDGMLLFYLVLIMDCFRNNPIWNPNAVSMPAGGEAQLLTVTDAVRFLQLWLTESTEHRRISSCLTSWLRR